MKPIQLILLGVLFASLVFHILFFLQPGRGGAGMLMNLGVGVACLVGLFLTRRRES
jgi:hypothetical protein